MGGKQDATIVVGSTIRDALEGLCGAAPEDWAAQASGLGPQWTHALQRLAQGPDPTQALLRALTLPPSLLGETALPDAALDLLHQGSYPARLLTVLPSGVDDLAAPSAPPFSPEELTERLTTQCAAHGPALGLGRVRTRGYVRLCRAEVENAPLETVTGGLSDLASACVAAALEAEGLTDRVCAFGMGKLGGHELNFLSDIDLIFVHDDDVSVGAKSERAALVELHDRLRKVVRLLEGSGPFRPLFRVDLRLRPFGSRGPLSQSLSATERYYEKHGRGWERQAWLRARPIAGRLDIGEALLDRLGPFVFRRTVTPAIFGEIDELMARARRDAAAAALRESIDLKHDEGGIRSVEFSIQALQLLHGGRHPSVRGQGTLGALDGLLATGLVSDREHRDLSEAYRFLRRVEHRVQLADGHHTHRIPAEARDVELLAQRLAVAQRQAPTDADGFLAQLQQHRDNVEAVAATISGPQSPEESTSDPTAAHRRIVLDMGAPTSRRRVALEGLGVRDPAEADALLRHVASRPDGAFAARGSAGVGARNLALACLDSADPDRALARLVEFAALRPAHYGIWRWLSDDSEQTRELVRLTAELFGASEPLSRGLIGFPVSGGRLRDESIGQLLGAGSVDLPDLEAFSQAAAESAPDPRGLDAVLLKFKQQQLVSIALHDLGQRPDPLLVGRALSDLADRIIRVLLRDVVAEAAADDPGSHGLTLSVFALGKHGMRAMDYGSDLDLLFVHDTDPELATRPIPQPTAIALGQRLVTRLEARAGGTRLYEVDMRLRPSGRQGLLVSPLSGFKRYHARALPVWEQLALTRLRPIAEATIRPELVRPHLGVPHDEPEGARVASGLLGRLAGDVDATVRATLGRAGPPDDVARATVELKQRIERELARESRKDEIFNAKTGRGACLELELLVCALCLQHAATPDEVLVPDMVGALDRLASATVITQDEASALCAAYRFLRLLLNRLRMTHHRGIDDPDRFAENSPRLPSLARRMGLPSADDLVRRYREATDLVRNAFTRYLGG